jgi:hypothetical protein
VTFCDIHGSPPPARSRDLPIKGEVKNRNI